jgi:sulfur transfer protein SufE
MVDECWTQIRDANREEREDAKDAVRQALEQLPGGTSDRELQRARDTALQPIKERIAARQDSEMRDQIASRLTSGLSWGMPEKLQEAAAEELREAIEEVPPGTPRAKLEEVRDQIATRFNKIYERRQRKQSLVDEAMSQVWMYIRTLEKTWDFEGKSAFALEREIQEAVREALMEELTGKETKEQVLGIMHRIVREELNVED